LDRTIRVRWDGEQTHHSPESLRAVFLQFGELEEVVVAPVSASNARRRGTGARPASALVVFRSIAAAHALMHVQHAGPDIQSFERFWARGAEPESVRSTISNHRFVPAADSSTINLTRRRSKRIPDISAIDLRQIPGSNLGFADFEALTLMRMRQSVAAGCIRLTGERVGLMETALTASEGAPSIGSTDKGADASSNNVVFEDSRSETSTIDTDSEESADVSGLTFFTRLYEIPVVNDAVTSVCRIAESNRYTGAIITYAEKVGGLAEKTR
ncbi:hypothetical protein IW139_006520, partial [Coemansia sp. RSA 353]